jgi:hypothetical protein
LILFTLLSHQWKSFWRSRSAGKSLAIQIFMGFMFLYLLSVAIAAGLFLKGLLVKGFPGEDVVGVFCGFLLYYFLIDLVLRFMVQDLPTLAVQPYLVQNIRRRQLIRFLNVRSLFSAINLLPLFLFIPFTIQEIGPLYGGGVMAGFVATFIFLTIFNHFLILYIKRKTIVNSWWLVGFFVVVALLGLCDYRNIFSFRQLSRTLFIPLLRAPLLALIPAAMAVAAFLNNYYFLYRNLYLDDIIGKDKRKESADYSFLNRFGAIGELIAVDIKLILRNKRAKTVVMSTCFLLFYGFILYKPENLAKGKLAILLFSACFILGTFANSYGLWLFSWQSGHFDGLMAARLSLRTYIKSKLLLFTAVATLLLILSSMYGFLSWKLLLIQLAAYFYIIGLYSVLAVYVATWNYKAIDISKKATFNSHGGMGGLPLMLYSVSSFLIPMGIYLPFAYLFSPWSGILAVGLVGLISLLLQDWWIDWLTKEFSKRKYLMLEGFREKN